MKDQNFKLLLLILVSFNSIAYSQNINSSPRWSIMVFGNYNMNFGISPAMNGNFKQFFDEYYIMGDVTKYPLADNSVKNYISGLQSEYRFSESNFSLYGSCSNIFLKISYQSDPANITDGSCYVSTLSIGCEYTFGNKSDLWNFFGKIGINSSLFYGNISHDNSLAVGFGGPYKYVLATEVRGGFETEIGGKLNIPASPLFIEFSTNYSNLNVIGKSSLQTKSTLYNGDAYLQDAADPRYPNIKSKTIDFLMIKIGIGYYL